MIRDPRISKTLLDSVGYLAERGFHGETIARATGLSKGQVYYRTGQLGIPLRSYRDGVSKIAKTFIAVTPCVTDGIRAKKGESYQVVGLQPIVKKEVPRNEYQK